jgi:hypothetical protein
MEIFLIYPVFIGIAIAMAELANQRGYSGRWWFLIGLLLPVISLVVLLLLKKRRPIEKTPVPKWMDIKVKTDKVLFTK